MMEERIIALETKVRELTGLPPIRDAITAEKEREAAEAKAIADKAEADAKAKEPVEDDPGQGDEPRPTPTTWKAPEYATPQKD
jgi:hypothetical protein